MRSSHSMLRISLLAASLCLVLAKAATAQKGQLITDAGDVKVRTIWEGLDHPWGMTFLPDGDALITERGGHLRRWLAKDSAMTGPLQGVPDVFVFGQGGLLDVAIDPNFARNQLVYISYAELGKDSLAGAAVGRARLVENALEDFEVIFRQEPKVSGGNHYGGRLDFAPDGKLFISLGERFKFEPAQDSTNTLGCVVRINSDGSIPQDNPFVGAPGHDAIWSFGHRNLISAGFHAPSGDYWVAEMGPMGGDEFNRPQQGRNYGWPTVSWGKNYDGSAIPDPTTQPRFADAAIVWTPTISPSGMTCYMGNMFPEWKGSMLIGGLTASGIVRVNVNGAQATEVERLPLVARVREVVEGPDGAVYVLTDSDKGKLLRLEKL